MKFLLAFLRAFFPFLFPSNLQPFSTGMQLATGGINPFPRGHFKFYGKLNASGRRRRSNRLMLSKRTRNKHR